MIPLSSNHLRGGIAGRTACGLEGRVWLIHITEAEVNYFEGQIIVKQQIFRLEVAMTYTTLVNVLYS